MSEPDELPVLDAAALKALCEPASVLAGCENCRGLNCPGWESVPGGYDTRQLSQVGTLRKDPFCATRSTGAITVTSGFGRWRRRWW